MNLPVARKNEINPFQNLSQVRPGMAFGLIIVIALLAFEIFNYSTTDFALKDLLGDLKFAGIPWSTVLTIAFCGIDFAGIARLFSPQNNAEEPREAWYLFGAWMLAATMNAVLTWWGVAMAVSNHTVRSTAVMDASTVTKVVPVFVALMVWVIRILIIGSLSMTGEKLLWGEKKAVKGTRSQVYSHTPAVITAPSQAAPAPRMPAPRPLPVRQAAPVEDAPSRPEPVFRPEPTYHSMSINARLAGSGEQKRM
jgi:hypothetical protein